MSKDTNDTGSTGEQGKYYVPVWRKTFLINPKFQLTFMGWMTGMALATIGIFFGATHYFFSRFEETGKSMGLPPEHLFFKFIHEQQYQMNIVMGVTAVVVFFVLCFVGLHLSHRVAGPLYRLVKHMREISDGKTIDDVKFRQKDYFQEVAEAFNGQLRYMRKNQPRKRSAA